MNGRILAMVNLNQTSWLEDCDIPQYTKLEELVSETVTPDICCVCAPQDTFRNVCESLRKSFPSIFIVAPLREDALSGADLYVASDIPSDVVHRSLLDAVPVPIPDANQLFETFDFQKPNLPDFDETMKNLCGFHKVAFVNREATDSSQKTDTLLDHQLLENTKLLVENGLSAPAWFSQGEGITTIWTVPVYSTAFYGNQWIALTNQANLPPVNHLPVLTAMLHSFLHANNQAAALQRIGEELEQIQSVPAIIPRLGIWNSMAMERLGEMLCAHADRLEQPVSVISVEMMGLQRMRLTLGAHYIESLERRTALALRNSIRTEDLLGQMRPGAFLILFISNADGAERVVTRIEERLRRLQNENQLSREKARFAVDTFEINPKDQLAKQLFISDTPGTTPPPAHTAEKLPPAEFSNSGRLLNGTYLLKNEISSGGMGVVYRGEDVRLRRPVAIKMLRPELSAGAHEFNNFRAEAELLASISHPNLVQVMFYGEEDGDAYIVMELVEGQSMAERIVQCIQESQTTPKTTVARIATQIGAALDAMHNIRLVHRDVKPGNLIVNPFNQQVVLVDVGIAQRMGEKGIPSGTPGFVAPEIIQEGIVTQRVDIYGLAASLYEIIELEPPFGAHSLPAKEILTRQKKGDMRPMNNTSLQEVFTKALHPDPEMRHLSAGEFASELSSLLLDTDEEDIYATDFVVDTRIGVNPVKPTGRFCRGVVFRSIPAVTGVRNAERWQETLQDISPTIAAMLAADINPTGWYPFENFEELASMAPLIDWKFEKLLYESGAATVRSSFRKFFPTSTTVLSPKTVLANVHTVWAKYHDWGNLRGFAASKTEFHIELQHSSVSPVILPWLHGFLLQLCSIAGAQDVTVKRDESEFQISWQKS